MSKQIAKNTFTGGLLMDMHPLSSQNTVLTNALNATLVTIDGDEMILLNDMGNLKVDSGLKDENGKPIYVGLTPGFIPIGVNTLNGIAYIVSFNPNTQEGEIGTFPSPDYPLCTPSSDCCINPDGYDPVIPDDPVDPDDPDDPIDPDDPVNPDDPVIPETPPEYVDLGLGVYWAKTNIGAENESDYGDYYAWGELNTKSVFTRENYKYLNVDIGTDIVGDTRYDVATKKYGKAWHMPTEEQMLELTDTNKCSHEWATVNGVNGYKITSKVPGCIGNSIFLPAAGYKNSLGLQLEGETGKYRASTYRSDPELAMSLGFKSEETFSVMSGERHHGFSVRPVRTKGVVTYSLSIKSSSGGSVSYNGTTITNKAQSFTINEGTSAIITITPNTGYKLSKLTVNGTNVTSSVSNNRYIISNVSVDTTVVALFAIKGDSEFPVPEAVDLGLSVKWAKWNMGAKSEYDGGGYYGWGDPTGEMTSTNSSDYAHGYNQPSICGTDLDIATAKWGSGWRLPTVDEVRELLDNSRIEHFTAENGVFGYNLTCNGQTIFIPIGGWKRGNLIEHETKPIYWTGDLNDALRPQLFVIDSTVQYRITENRDKSIHEYIRPVYDGGQSPSEDSTSEYDEYAVDLGLTSLWSSVNLDNSEFFSWGELLPKDVYTLEGYEHYNEANNSFTDIGNVISNTNYDAAKAMWGGKWHMPTYYDFQELNERCTWEKTTVNGVNGYKVTGPSGNSIFLPFTGYYTATSTSPAYSDSKARYLSGTLYTLPATESIPHSYVYAYAIDADANPQESEPSKFYRYWGGVIRPVRTKDNNNLRTVKKLRALKVSSESEVLAYDVNSSKEGYELHKNLVNKYQPLYNLYKGCACSDEGTHTSCLEPKQDSEITCLLHPLRTTHFNFNLEHPVEVNLQPSYDGSVNIIINDGYNIPRLINSRFSAKENGTWEVPDRHRNTNNIYTVYEDCMQDYEEPMCNCDDENKEIVDGIKDIKCGCSDISCKQELENQSLFDISTSLSKRVTTFPITVYNGVLNTGNLPVGNYTLYFKYCDEDGNETDFVGESGIISIFKGNDKDPFSIDGGERDMDSNKSINVTLKYIDRGYSFVKVYYSRTSAAADENRVASAYEIIKTYPVDNGECNIIINGDEEKNQIPLTSLSLQLTIVNSAETEVQIANRLFLGNVQSQELYYKQLSNLSLYVVPYVKRELSKNRIGHINASNYSDNSNIGDDSIINFKFTHEYYNTKNIYYNVGYWNEEYYRLGIVYIFEDGSLSPVYNILGYETSNENASSNKYKGVIDENNEERCQDVNNLFNSNFNIKDIQYTDEGFIDYNQLNYLQLGNSSEERYFVKDTINAKGVIRINDDEIQTYAENTPGNYLYSIGVYMDLKIISELKDKYCVKGFFVVRQKRIPTILAQGFTMPWDKEAKIPIIEYWGARHDFSRGTTIQNKEGSCSDGLKFNEIFPYTNNLYLSIKEGNYLHPIKRRCDVVESFLHLHAADSFGLANPKDTNKATTQDDDYWSNECYYRGCSIHHEYLQRLHEILPLTIDDEMIARSGGNSSDQDTDNLFKAIRIKIGMSGTWYRVEANGKIVKVDSAPSGYSASSNVYQEDEGISMINDYVNSINNNRMIDMGEYYTWNEEDGSGVLNSYKLQVTDLNVTYNTNYESESSTWQSLVLKNGSSYYESYYGHNQDVNPENTLSYIIEGKTGNTKTVIATIQKVKYEDGEIGSSYEEFKPSSQKGYGYSTINPYYGGALFHRLTGEIWEGDILFNNDRVFTGCGDQWNAPITYLANRYMNGRLSVNKYVFHEEDEDENYARTSSDRFRGVSLATQKHFWNLYKNCDKQQLTAICPEFEVRLPFFNQLFTGAEYKCKYNKYQYGILHRKPSNERYYYQMEKSSNWEETTYAQLNNAPDKQDYYYYAMADGVWLKEKNSLDYILRPYKIVSVTDSVPVVAIDNTVFKSVLGSEQEAYRFEFINEEHAPKSCLKHIKDGHTDRMLCNTGNSLDFNLIRGYYTPYLGMVCQEKSSRENYWDNEKGRGYGRNFTIYDSSYEDSFKTNANIRMQDSSPYYMIGERIAFDLLYDRDYVKNIHSIKQLTKTNKNVEYDLYRGDCFLYTFTHRLNRNFNDPVAPTNDHIINPTTWHDHFKPDETDTDSTEGTSKLSKINRGDVNAVKLGSWITVKGRSSYNLSIRSLDERYTTEAAMMGRARGFYPLQQASADGGYKIPNSYLINDGFGSTVGEKVYFTLPEAPYYNNVFEDRIVYSDINIQDAYKNGYRTFKTSTITDYTKQYGKIVKLVDWYGHILCIFEHGVGILPVNERVESGEGIGGPVFIDNNKVLPDVPSMISDKFGSQWKDSVIKTPYAVYGVDTSTKKIWKITGSTTLPTLSVISDFKIENFLKENLPIKDNESDVYVGLKNVKTHYNQTKSDVIFTFYMDKENTEHRLGPDDKLLDEHAWSICLNEITSDLSTSSSGNFVTFYSWIPLESFNLNNKFYSFDREMVRGILSFAELVPIDPSDLIKYIGRPVYNEDGTQAIYVNYCGSEQRYAKKYSYPNECVTSLNLWEHNNPFIRPLPTHWYGKQHPFEFEFMVIDDPSVQKIWEDLKIISNNAEPESFHFSITGDNYEFTNDIPNIYYRLEATKEIYKNLGSHISYNENYLKVHPNQQIKSTIFPLYYNRLDTYDRIYDDYQQMTGNYVDYQNLSGTEVYRNPRSRKFELVTHIKNTPIDGLWIRLTEENYKEYFNDRGSMELNDYLEERYNEYYNSKYSKTTSCNRNFSTLECYPKIKKERKPDSAFLCSEEYWYYIWLPQSRLRGNSHYKEDKWNIQIPNISFMQKNENRWIDDKPTIVLNQIPNDIIDRDLTYEKLPNTYNSLSQVSTNGWTFRKETKIRDKYCKIKVRYSGEDLAIISAVLTTFNISYA